MSLASESLGRACLLGLQVRRKSITSAQPRSAACSGASGDAGELQSPGVGLSPRGAPPTSCRAHGNCLPAGDPGGGEQGGEQFPPETSDSKGDKTTDKRNAKTVMGS